MTTTQDIDRTAADTSAVQIPRLSAMEQFAAILLRAIRSNRSCDSANHHLGVHGHDDGPAAFVVTIGCPRCDAESTRQRRICAGRVQRVQERDAANLGLCCTVCGLEGPVAAFWRSVNPIS